MSYTKIISVTEIDFDSLISVSSRAIGRNPSQAADRSPRKLSKAEKYVSILDSILNEESQPGLHPVWLGFIDVHVQFGLEVGCSMEVMNFASGMQFLLVEGGENADYAIIKGNLSQWRDAIISGTNSRSPNIQQCFCKLHSQFEAAGYRLWTDCVARRQPGSIVFRLEHK